jgi:hypothetical protein
MATPAGNSRPEYRFGDVTVVGDDGDKQRVIRTVCGVGFGLSLILKMRRLPALSR